jgi:hypothetical protein
VFEGGRTIPEGVWVSYIEEAAEEGTHGGGWWVSFLYWEGGGRSGRSGRRQDGGRTSGTWIKSNDPNTGGWGTTKNNKQLWKNLINKKKTKNNNNTNRIYILKYYIYMKKKIYIYISYTYTYIIKHIKNNIKTTKNYQKTITH